MLPFGKKLKKKKTTDASSERYYFSLILPAFIAEVIIHAI